jgi:hypothetical protein
MEGSSPVGGQSSNGGVSEVDSVISKTTDYMFGNEATVGFPLART